MQGINGSGLAVVHSQSIIKSGINALSPSIENNLLNFLNRSAMSLMAETSRKWSRSVVRVASIKECPLAKTFVDYLVANLDGAVYPMQRAELLAMSAGDRLISKNLIEVDELTSGCPVSIIELLTGLDPICLRRLKEQFMVKYGQSELSKFAKTLCLAELYQELDIVQGNSDVEERKEGIKKIVRRMAEMGCFLQALDVVTLIAEDPYARENTICHNVLLFLPDREKLKDSLILKLLKCNQVTLRIVSTLVSNGSMDRTLELIKAKCDLNEQTALFSFIARASTFRSSPDNFNKSIKIASLIPNFVDRERELRYLLAGWRAEAEVNENMRPRYMMCEYEDKAPWVNEDDGDALFFRMW